MNESTDASIKNLEMQVSQLSRHWATQASANATRKVIELINRVVQLKPKVSEKVKEVVVEKELE